jgi:DNA polymerase V
MFRHGGKRSGAGRRCKYGEPTQPLRVPRSVVQDIERWLGEQAPILASIRESVRWPTVTPIPLELALYAARIPAGYPSPVDDLVENQIDLNQHLIRHPEATFFVKVSGDSMLGIGIHPGDLLVVDRLLEATHGKVVIAVVDNELTVKRLHCRNGQIRLLAENEDYPAINLAEGADLQILGVVTNVIHSL